MAKPKQFLWTPTLARIKDVGATPLSLHNPRARVKKITPG
jgi:hypothetical protein